MLLLALIYYHCRGAYRWELSIAKLDEFETILVLFDGQAPKGSEAPLLCRWELSHPFCYGVA